MFVKYNLPISSIEMAKRLLYEAQFAVVPGSDFGKNGEDICGFLLEDMKKIF